MEITEEKFAEIIFDVWTKGSKELQNPTIVANYIEEKIKELTPPQINNKE